MDKEESVYLAIRGHKFNIQDPQYKTIRVWRTIIHSYSSSTRYMEMWKVHGELLCGYMESYMDLDGQQVYPIW